MKVPLSDEMFIGILHPVEAAREEYSFALAAGLRLHNKRLGLLVVELKLEVFGILRQYPRGREEVILLGALALHSLQISSE